MVLQTRPGGGGTAGGGGTVNVAQHMPAHDCSTVNVVLVWCSVVWGFGRMRSLTSQRTRLLVIVKVIK